MRRRKGKSKTPADLQVDVPSETLLEQADALIWEENDLDPAETLLLMLADRRDEYAERARQRLSVILWRRGDEVGTLSLLEELARSDKESVALSATSSLAAIYQWKGDTGRAQRLYQELAASGDEHYRYLAAHGQGKILMEAGRYADAEPLLRTAAESGEEDCANSALMELGLTLGFLGRADEAIAVLREAANNAEESEKPRAKLRLANQLQLAGQSIEAEALFRELANAASDRVAMTAKSNLGGLLENLGRLDEAESILREIIEDGDKREAAWSKLYLADIALARSHRDGALQLLREAIAADEDATPAAQHRLAHLVMDNDPDEAEILLRRVVESQDSRELPEAALDLVSMFLRRGHLRRAQKLCQTVLDSNGTSSRAWLCLGVIFIGRNQYDKAEQLFKELRTTQDHGVANKASVGLAITYMLDERPTEADEVLRDLTTDDPEVSAQAVLTHALILLGMGEDEEAQAELARLESMNAPKTAAFAQSIQETLVGKKLGVRKRQEVLMDICQQMKQLMAG